MFHFGIPMFAMTNEDRPVPEESASHTERHSSVDTVGPQPPTNGIDLHWRWQSVAVVCTICTLVGGLIAFSFGQFSSVVQDRQAFSDRMTDSEKDRREMHDEINKLNDKIAAMRDEQVKNSEFRTNSKQDLQDMKDMLRAHMQGRDYVVKHHAEEQP
jgi:septal ring factor EnvC (AmiA/AmiB activator)